MNYRIVKHILELIGDQLGLDSFPTRQQMALKMVKIRIVNIRTPVGGTCYYTVVYFLKIVLV